MTHVATHSSKSFNILSLCAGIGGLDLGLRLACEDARTVCYVEREIFCATILAGKAQNGWLDDAPIWSDLKTFDGLPWRGVVDCIIGGYPCQPFSLSGKRQGEADPRHLWPDIARIVAEVQPAFCFFENVPGHLSMGFEAVATELEDMGYRVATGIFSAAEIGAPHVRERLFILAHSEAQHPRGLHERDTGQTDCGQPRYYDPRSGSASVAYSVRQPLQGAFATGGQERQSKTPPSCRGCFPPHVNGDWESIPDHLKPTIHRMADGSAHRLDRLAAVGNAVCPVAAANAFTTLLGAINHRTRA